MAPEPDGTLGKPTDNGLLSMERIRVAALQTHPCWGDVAGNAEEIMRMLAATDAHLTVAPELALTGYVFTSKGALRPLSLCADNEYFPRFTDLLKRTNRYLVIGFAEADGESIYNSSALLGPNGLISVYRKTHLFWNEKHLFEPGNSGFSVHETSLGLRIGMMICFDWVFPEAARSLAVLGADIIAHPSNLVLPYYQQSMPTRALENRVYTVTANRIGTDGAGGDRATFTGRSIIVDPNASVLAQAGVDAVATIYAEIDVAVSRNKWMTPENELFTDRRPDLYHR